MADPELTFEDAYRQLDQMVRKLEAGGLPLEENLQLFEQAMELARLCGARLDAAELRILRLAGGGGTVETGDTLESGT